MTIIICSKAPNIKSALARKLLPHGINLVTITTLNELETIIPEKGKISFVDDNEFDEKKLLASVARIKKDEEKRKCRILLLTKSSDMHFIKTLVELGIEAVLQRSLHPETIANKFFSFIQKIASQQNSQRRFIRVKPQDDEQATIKFLLNKTKSFVKGAITDISMGGVAAKFSALDAENIKENCDYNNAQIVINQKNIVVNLKTVKKGGTLAAFSISKIRDNHKDLLAEYIYQKTQDILSV